MGDCNGAKLFVCLVIFSAIRTSTCFSGSSQEDSNCLVDIGDDRIDLRPIFQNQKVLSFIDGNLAYNYSGCSVSNFTYLYNETTSIHCNNTIVSFVDNYNNMEHLYNAFQVCLFDIANSKGISFGDKSTFEHNSTSNLYQITYGSE